MEPCRRCHPRASRLPATARCPPPLSSGPASDPWGSTCTCRSARRGAATATSTPTPRPSSGEPGRRRAPRATPTPRRRTSRRASRRRCWGRRGARSSTVFFGGGTPTLLPPADLVGMLGADPRRPSGWSRAPRSRPSRTPTASTSADLEQLREGGINRISFGMQSSVSHVLKVLDRTHDPERLPRVVEWARAGGLRAGQPRPHLRHAGGDAGRLGRIAGRGPFLSSPTTSRRTP